MRKKRYKTWAVIFSLFAFGSVNETYRIFTSSAPDIAENRKELIPMAAIMTIAAIFFAIRFWWKTQNEKF